jgi:hypothetical protein
MSSPIFKKTGAAGKYFFYGGINRKINKRTAAGLTFILKRSLLISMTTLKTVRLG